MVVRLEGCCGEGGVGRVGGSEVGGCCGKGGEVGGGEGVRRWGGSEGA